MGRLPAQMIRAHSPSLITPFHERTVENGKTFGLGPSGYDVRIAQSLVLGPNKRFSLASTIEHFDLPANIAADVKDKSSWIRQGLMIGNTTCEPGWRGHLTLELFYAGDDPLMIMAGDPIAQITFERLVAPTELPYAGKYQDQGAGPQAAIFERAKIERHAWSEPVRDQFLTVRRCSKCRMEKITHHESGGIPWTTFERNGMVSRGATPPCDGGADV